MTRSQRRWHLRAWLPLGLTIAVVLVAALRQRTSALANTTTPAAETEHSR
ncbi:MAG: hypothetical protein AABZ53_07310 [Planctomycetota bacterium]